MERVTIKAIHTPDEHRQAISAIDLIMDLEAPDEADLVMLETLAILVERYEEKVFPLERPTVVEAIRFRMDQLDLSQAKLAELIGFPKSRVSDVLNGGRLPSIEMIRALHERLGIPLEILVGWSKTANVS